MSQNETGGAPLRVLFVIPGPGTGSSMIFARRQVEILAGRGFEAETFYLESRTSPRVLLAEWLRFREVRTRFAPDLIHAHFGTVTAAFSVLASVFASAPTSGRVPVVVSYRGSDLNPPAPGPGAPAPLGRLRAWAGVLLSQLSALGAAATICVSEELKRRLWWGQARATVLPTGVDLREFQPGSRRQARARLRWPQGDVVVLFNAGAEGLRLGRRPGNKRLDLAEAAVECLRREMPGVRLEVMRGEVDPTQMPDYMRASDCLLMTSDREGSPTVVQEALASNLAVVSVEAGDVPERLAGLTGCRIAGREPEVLARAMGEVLSRIRPDVPETPVRSGGEALHDDYCSHRIAARIGLLYREVTGRESAGREPVAGLRRHAQGGR